MIFNEDLLVGGVSILLGTLALLSAIFNWDACFQLLKIRKVESKWGRGTARLFYALLGVALIALGCAIAMGFGPNKKNEKKRERSQLSHHLVQWARVDN